MRSFGILQTWQSTFKSWAPVLRSAGFLNQGDATFKDYSPLVTGYNAMTITSFSIGRARYALVGSLVFFRLKLQIKAGGVADVLFRITPPIPPVLPVADDPSTDAFSAFFFDTGTAQPIASYINFQGQIEAQKPSGNWSVEATTHLIINGFYERA